MSEWIKVSERLPELTETDWLKRKLRRVYFVLKSQPEEIFGRAKPLSTWSNWYSGQADRTGNILTK